MQVKNYELDRIERKVDREADPNERREEGEAKRYEFQGVREKWRRVKLERSKLMMIASRSLRMYASGKWRAVDELQEATRRQG